MWHKGMLTPGVYFMIIQTELASPECMKHAHDAMQSKKPPKTHYET